MGDRGEVWETDETEMRCVRVCETAERVGVGGWASCECGGPTSYDTIETEKDRHKEAKAHCDVEVMEKRGAEEGDWNREEATA